MKERALQEGMLIDPLVSEMFIIHEEHRVAVIQD
jgi:hypothetical protein